MITADRFIALTLVITCLCGTPIATQSQALAYVPDNYNTPDKTGVVTIIGTGYVGLVTGAGLASLGNNVICADISHDRMALLNQGIMPIYEPDLKELVAYGVDQGLLSFTTDVGEAIKQASIIFIAVNTPMGKDGAADLTALLAVAKTVAEHMNGHKTIVIKSTVPIGTGYYLEQVLHEEYGVPLDQFTIVSNPEFFREGSAVYDFMHPDRIVIGVETNAGFEVMAQLYRLLIDDGIPLIHTNIPTAELSKYASNAFLALKLSFINEIANLCDVTGAYIKMVALIMGLDNRISPHFLKVGPGYGGSCFPKDTLALIHMAKENCITLHTVDGLIQANNIQKLIPLKKLEAICPSCSGKTIAILGVAFKAGTDDVRYSPALTIIEALLEQGATIKAYDPEAMANAALLYPTITCCTSLYEAVEGADALIIMTEWDEFKHLNLERVKSLMHGAIIIDARNILDAHQVESHGFYYDGIGQALHYTR